MQLAPLLVPGKREDDPTGQVPQLGEDIGELDDREERRRSAEDDHTCPDLGRSLLDPLLERLLNCACETTLDGGEVLEFLREHIRQQSSRLEHLEGQRGEVDVTEGHASVREEVEEFVKAIAEVVFLFGRIDDEDTEVVRTEASAGGWSNISRSARIFVSRSTAASEVEIDDVALNAAAERSFCAQPEEKVNGLVEREPEQPEQRRLHGCEVALHQRATARGGGNARAQHLALAVRSPCAVPLGRRRTA